MPANQTLYTELAELIDQIYIWSVSLGGVLAFGIIVYAGIMWIFSAGNVEKRKDAMDRIVQASLGLGLLLLAVVILNSVPGIAQIDAVDSPTAQIAKIEPLRELSATEHEAIQADMKTRLAAAGRNIEKLKAILADLITQHEQVTKDKTVMQYDARHNAALYAFFKGVQGLGLDIDIYRNLDTLTEKAYHVRLHHFADLYAINNELGDVDIVAIATDLGVKEVADLYNGLTINNKLGYQDQRYFVSYLAGGQLAAFFEQTRLAQSIPIDSSEVGNTVTDPLFRIVSQLDIRKVQQLYINSPKANQKLIVRRLMALDRIDEAVRLWGPTLP